MPGLNAIMDELILKYLQQTLSEAEQTQLNEWLASSDENKELFEKLTDQQYISAALDNLYLYDEERGWETIKRKFPFKEAKPIKKFSWRRIAAAAAFILLGTSAYFLFISKAARKNDIVEISNTTPNDIAAPKGTKAMITLSDGRTVLLDSVANGTLAIQGKVNVIKTVDGQINYNGSAVAIEYNTLFNPRGSKVQPLTLSDGTKVWLNSESSIRFPIAFMGNERRVEITGEAYFEVTKDGTKKFIVTGNNVTTEVLGTYFNVNTYTDESSIKVTLLEGSVKVIKGSSLRLLQPGQQAQVTNEVKVVNGVDLEEVMAWKNGRFQFEGAGIEEVMRQIARWYDVEVVYEGKPKEQHFRGGISRDVEVSKLLKMLETTTAVHFRIAGKKVIVMP